MLDTVQDMELRPLDFMYEPDATFGYNLKLRSPAKDDICVFEAEVIVRHNPDLTIGQTMALMTERIRMWLRIASALRQGVGEIDPQSFTGLTLVAPRLGAANVTVKGLRPVTNLDGDEVGIITLTDQSDPQATFDWYRALSQQAIKIAAAIKPIVDPASIAGVNRGMPPALTPPSQPAPTTPATQPSAPITGVIAATHAPTPSTPQYTPGQMVSFEINKITKGSNAGSVTWGLWGPLGSQYPLLTIYRSTKGGADSSDFKKVGTVLDGLGLSVDTNRLEVTGRWLATATVHHYQGKEKFNMENLVAY